MKIKHIELSKEEATKELEYYKKNMTALKGNKWLSQMSSMYSHLKEGKIIINIYDVFKQSGLKNDLPKLSIQRADKNNVIFSKTNMGSGQFGIYNKTNWGSGFSCLVRIPRGTFNFRENIDRDNKYHEAQTPIIPMRLMPEYNLMNYFILWEVEKWTKFDMPKPDPLLLKRITENLFVVLASWDLTELERMVIRK